MNAYTIFWTGATKNELKEIPKTKSYDAQGDSGLRLQLYSTVNN